jgi:hypothetical protein
VSASLKRREPDADAIASFVRALFAYADDGSFVSLRAFDQFTEGVPPPYIVGAKINGAGLDSVIESAVAGARFAANHSDALVFAPPICTFRHANKAAESDLVNGISISVELDSGNTTRARERLEGLLGPATVVVESGGEWIDPETGEIFAKLHLHWRLSEPTREAADHAALKHARRLACALVNADPTAKTSVHPLRWPGSWHLKATPKLAHISTLEESAEVHLHEAVEALETAAENAGLQNAGMAGADASGTPQADIELIKSALATIPNNDEHWDEWTRIGMMLYRATGASQDGLDAWCSWSEKSRKFVARACEDRWSHFATSPPTRIGAGTLFMMAKAAGWQRPRTDPEPEPAATGETAADPAAFFDPWAELQPPSFPIDALPTVLRAFAEDRARLMGADPCALTWAAISAASAALNGSIRLKMKRHDHWSEAPAIWVALIGRPSTKKTPIINAAWEPLQRAQKLDLDRWRQELAEWKALPKNDRGPDEPKPRRRLVSHDGTMEALQDVLGRQDRGIGVLRDELSGWLGSLEKYAGSKASGADRAFFLQAWNGGPNVVDRVARGTVNIDNLLVTICGGIQPDRLRQFSDLTDDGLWQRFLPIVVAPATRGVDERPSHAVTEYANAIDRILTVPGETQAALSDGAHEVRAGIEQQIFDLEQSDILGARFASFCGKLVGMWGRLCLVLNYLGKPPDDKEHFIISRETALRASTLILQSVIPCAARVYAATGGAGADIEATRSVAGYILTKQKSRVLASDLAHNVRACRAQPLDHVQRVVSPLVAGGWLVPEKDWNPFAWKVAPDVHVLFEKRARTEALRRAAIRDVLTGRAVPSAE